MNSKRFAAAIALQFFIASLASAAPTMTVQNVGVTPGGNREWSVVIDPDATSSSNHSVAVEIGLTVNGSTVTNPTINSSVWNFANPGIAIFGWETGSPCCNGKPVGMQFKNYSGPPPSLVLSGPSSFGIGLPGDYNHNGVVAAEDFTVFGNTLGQIGFLDADGNFNGIVDNGDHDVWAANYGNVVAASANLSLNPNPNAAIFISYGSTNVGSGAPVELLRFETLGTGPTTVGWGGAYAGNARLAQAATNYDSGNGSVQVPEPASAGLISVCLAVTSALRRPRSAAR